MIKLYHGDINNSVFGNNNNKEILLEYNNYEVINNGNSLTFKIKTFFNFNIRNFECTIDIESNKGREMDMMAIANSKAADIQIWYVHEYIDRRYGYSPIDSDGRNRNKLGRILIDPDGNVFIALSLCFKDIEGFDNEIMDFDTYSVSHYFLRDSEWYRNRTALMEKKKTLITQTDIYRSTSYLEAQVDLLTKLVIDLLNNKEVDKDKLSLLETANQYSVLNIKPDTAVSEEFTENKANFRKIQEEYYESLKEES